MIKDLKPTLVIFARFLIVYLVLLVGYQIYLNFSKGDLDGFSKLVAHQSCFLQTSAGFPSQTVDQPKFETTYFYTVSKYTSRMVEGCNAISVMILFVAFVFAFYKGLKTFMFVVIGLALLHVMNIMRIAGLNIIILEHPTYSKMFHDYFFPAIIYGTVVVLWIVWIKFFALKDENS